MSAARAARFAAGICASCPNRTIDGKVCCQACIARATARVQARRREALEGREAAPKKTKLSELKNGPRCSRCDLLLPCNPCVPSSTEVDVSRYDWKW